MIEGCGLFLQEGIKNKRISFADPFICNLLQITFFS